MQLIKKIFNTILILFGIAAMVVIFCFALMMIFHVSIFGLTYVKIDISDALKVVDIDVTNLKTIDVSTSNIDVIIQYSEDAGLKKAAFNTIVEMSGIVKDDVKTVSYVKNPTIDENGVLKIETKEPEGWLLSNSSHVRIVLPQGKSMENIIVNTNAKNIDVGNDDNFEVDNMEITAGKKIFNAAVNIGSKLTINNNLKLKTNYGRIVIDSKINGNVEVDSLAGSIQINSSVGGNLTVTGTNPFVQVGSFPGNWRNKTEFEEKDFKDLKNFNVGGDVIINNITNGGNIKVSGNIGGYVEIHGDAVEFWANTIDEGLLCDSGSNQIRIFGSLGKVGSTNECVINSGYGTLFINNCYTKLIASCDKGGIRIANAYNDVKIENKNSDTYVNFAEGVSKLLEITNEHGNITATNIRGKAVLNAENGSVTAEFLKVAEESKVIAKFNANVKVKDGETFNLTAKAKNASVNISLGSVNYQNWDKAQKDGDWKIISSVVNPTSPSDTPSNSLLVQVNEKGKLEVGFLSK